MAARVVLGKGVGRAAGHALVVQPVQVQRVGAGHAGVLAGATAGAAALVARLAGLRGRLVVLGAQTLDAQTVLEHKVRGTGGTGQRPRALARLAVVVALLAPEGRLVVALRTLGVALTARQLPALGALDALIPAGSTARVTAQVALFAVAAVAVVPVSVRGGEESRDP